MYYFARYKFIYILPTKYPCLDELNLSEFTLHLSACLSSDLVTGFTSPSFPTIAKSVLRTKTMLDTIVQTTLNHKTTLITQNCMLVFCSVVAYWCNKTN